MTAPQPDDVVLAGGVRTPFSRFGGALRAFSSVDLAAHAVAAALAAVGVDGADVDDVVLGFSMPAEYAYDGSIPARSAMLKAGLPEHTRSLTIDRACCSSMTAIHLGYQALRAGTADVVVAGGAENMGRSSFLMSAAGRWGHKRGALVLKDPLEAPGADIGGKPVSVDAGEVAVEHGVTREDQDAWAVRSQRRYRAAADRGFFAGEITPVAVPGPRGTSTELAEDEEPRPDATVESLARLRTVYGSPTVTPGNAPGLSTGATAVVLTRRSWAAERGVPVLATVRAVHSIARAPREIAVAPAPALAGVLTRAGWTLADLAVVEVNEAFAAVPLVTARVLAAGDAAVEAALLERMNPNGGAVALGHPTGASGARLVLTAARQLRDTGGGRAAAAICGGLGQADAVALEVAG